MKLHKLIKRLLNEFNFKRQAEELGLPIWQAPSLLFLIMGLTIILTTVIIYFVAQNYESTEVFIIGEFSIVTVLFTIGNFIIKSIEEMAKANKMKTEFVSVASHQLKTPVAEIGWELELLLSKYKEGISEKQLNILAEVSRSNERMSRLVNDLLDVARIDQGRLALVKESTDIVKLVQEVVASNEILAKSHNVIIKFHQPSSAIHEVIADKRRIAVVLDNLISNGIKYAKEKGRVSVLVEDKNGAVEISVMDDGVGIPLSQQDQIFEKFFRSDNANKNKIDGTGLGLYIAKNIIEQSGGKIWFYSEENKGSSFAFTLPY